MRKEKIILSIFAVIALVCLGIGYAALTDTLTATANISGLGVNDTDGDGDIDEDDTDIEQEQIFDVDWVDEPETQAVATAVATRSEKMVAVDGLSIDDATDKLSFNITDMFLKGDKVVLTSRIYNNSDYDAVIAITDPAVSNKVKVTTAIAYEDEATNLASKAYATVTITIELTETLFTEKLDAVPYEVSIVATAVAK